MGCAAVADFRRRDRSDRRPREAISDVDRCLRAARLPAHGSAIRVRPAVRVEAELRQPPRGRLGLPKLLDLLKEAMLLPSYIAAEREKNLRDRDQAKLARMSTQESLADPETVKWKVEAIQRAEIAAAEARKARSIADASEILGALDSETIARVRELIRRPRHPCANGCCPTSRERAGTPSGHRGAPSHGPGGLPRSATASATTAQASATTTRLETSARLAEKPQTAKAAATVPQEQPVVASSRRGRQLAFPFRSACA